jgi:hypothetical protein
MIRTSFLALAAGVACSLAASPARADYIPAWSITTVSSVSQVQAGGPGNPAVLLVNQHQLTLGSHDVVAENLFTVSNSTTPAAIAPTPFTETAYITDLASKQTQAVSFNFTLSGQVGSKSSFLAVTPTGPTTQTVHLGHYFYKVTVDPFHAPGDPGKFGGSLVFNVKVTHNPEPSTLLLAALGLPLAAVARRRKATPAAPS